MNQSATRILFSGMAMIFLITACAPAAPGPDPDQVARDIATSVALTVAAQNAQTAAAKPSDTPIPPPTETVPPTPIPALPTATPFVVVPPTAVSGGGGGSITVKPDYACDIIRRRPFDNEIFRPNDPFDIRWTIVNTGTKNLRAGTDVKFSIGSLMTGVTRVELPELKPGDQYEIILDAVAPQKEGHHVMTWVVEGPLCYPYAAIIVEK
jgi:hypothetical protein